MDLATARSVVVLGTITAVGLWLWGLQSYTRLASAGARFKRTVPVRSTGPEAVAELVRWGTAEGRTIVERGDRRLRVKLRLFEVDLALLEETAGPRLEVRADLTSLHRRYLVGVGSVVFVIAPALIIGLFAALYFFAAPSDHPGMRGQVFQILQTVHGLWPPLVFSRQYRSVRRQHLDPIPGNLKALIEVAAQG